MTTKRDSKVARANLWVTRDQIKNVAGSAQMRAFKARQLAKQARDAAERELRKKKAAAAKKKSASANEAENANEPEGDPAPPPVEPAEPAEPTETRAPSAAKRRASKKSET